MFLLTAFRILRACFISTLTTAKVAQSRSIAVTFSSQGYCNILPNCFTLLKLDNIKTSIAYFLFEIISHLFFTYAYVK